MRVGRDFYKIRLSLALIGALALGNSSPRPLHH